MKTYWLIVTVLLVNLSSLLVNDYFPGTLAALGIPPWILFAVIALMVLLSALTLKTRREKKRYMIIFPVLMIAVPVLVLAVSAALGGEPHNSISLTSPSLWIGAAVTLWFFWLEYVRASRKEAEDT
ncbi:hypothetical protein A1A1_15628 [Planococcus antarcticus DSM 14505]|uniref:Uncharacterized protein n=1 Tax=Planococcus antarcticus DSM 14505 TaxID=1185653 RepID=A0AA87LRP7_9BACL|nr:hypothetical protein [Planococcus antarcticus]EIM05519.1 hypothetical protein A1A1_15628 [Planococcus antarcticus DSM 14505]